MSAQAFYPLLRILDSASKVWLKLLDSLHLVIQNIPEKMDILVAQTRELHACVMVLRSSLQISF